jgi:hypothetical protein
VTEVFVMVVLPGRPEAIESPEGRAEFVRLLLGQSQQAVFLKSCDHEAYDGRGSVDVTTDLAEAMKFESLIDLLEFWRKVSTTRPTRPDGRPNRPLATLSITPYKYTLQ